MFTNHQINIFLSLSKTENFSKTASLFNISRQSVCKTLRTIEEALGCELFSRKGHSLNMNENGQLVKDYMIDETRLYREFLTKLNELKNCNTEYFTIGLQSHLILKPESMAVKMFLNNSDSKVQIRSDRGSPNMLLSGLANQTLDIIILRNSLVGTKTGFFYKKLRDVDIIMQVAKSNPALSKTSTAESFASAPFTIDRFESEPENDFRKRVRQQLNKYSLSPTQLVEAENADSVYLNMIVGNCITITTSDGWYASSPSVQNFALNETDSLICMWRKKDTNPLIAQFITTVESFIKK